MTKIKINRNEKNDIVLGSEIPYSDRQVFYLPKEIHTWKFLITLRWKEKLETFEIIVEYINQNELVYSVLIKEYRHCIITVDSEYNDTIADSFAVSTTLKTNTAFQMIVEEFKDIDEWVDKQNESEEIKEEQRIYFKTNPID
jgi:hypothetical protein